MAKMRFIIIAFLLISIGHNTAGQNILREKVEFTYLSQIGVRQTGNNTGPRVDAYLATTGLDPGYAWCAAFVAWVLSENNINNPKSAWSPAWFANKYVIYSHGSRYNTNPLPGDVFGIYFSRLNRIAHVGFIHRYSEKFTVTVEGNTNDTGSRTGDGVYLKRRPTRQINKVARYIK